MYYNDDNDDIIDWTQQNSKNKDEQNETNNDNLKNESKEKIKDKSKEKIKDKLKEKIKGNQNDQVGGNRTSNEVNSSKSKGKLKGKSKSKSKGKSSKLSNSRESQGNNSGTSTTGKAGIPKGTGATGSTSTGGTAVGGASTGGTAAGGATAGGATAGGAAAGGVATGGVATGGAAAGGVAAGGAVAGGAATAAGTAAVAATPVGWIILIVIVVIILIIIIVGIIAFLLTLPGVMSAKFHEIFDEVARGIRLIFRSDVDATPIDENVKDLAKYLEEMEYDLVGYGFVKPERDDTTPVAEQLIDQGYQRVVIDDDVNEAEENSKKGEEIGEIDESDRNYKVYYAKIYDSDTGYMDDVYSGEFYDSDGMLYDSTGLPKKDANGNYKKYGITYDSNNNVNEVINDEVLRTYILSERRFYIIRNNDDSWFQRVATYINHVLTGYKASWAQGMIELWVAADGIAESKYELWDKLNLMHPSNVNITDDGQMKVKVGWFNNPIYFKLDGWSGRYGLSTDMLISLHLATLSPDLVTTMAQTYDTKVQVYLDYVKDSEVYAYFHTPEMPKDSYPSYEDFQDYMQDSSWNPFDGWFLSKKEAEEIMDDFGIDSLKTGIYTCGGHDPSQVLYIYKDNYDIKDYTNSDYCYNEMARSSEMNWEEDVIYNQHLDRYFGNWSVSGSSDSAPVNYYWLNYTPNEDNRNDIYDECKTSKGHKPTIINYEGGLNYIGWSKSKNGTDENDIHLSLLDELLHGLKSMYDKVKANPDNFNVIQDDNPASCPLTFATIFDPNSEYRFDNYISLSDFKTIPEENDGYYEIPIAVWKTNDQGLAETDENHNAEYDGELILSLLVKKKEVDNNYDFTAILYRNFSDDEKNEKGFTTQNTSEKTCSEELADDELDELCNSCRRYVRDIMRGLRKIDDDNFKTYKPYIARVVGSWFRDTYFILPDDDDNDIALQDGVYNYYASDYGYSDGDLERSKTNVIQNDAKFQEATGELWTDYLLDEDEYNYALFVIKADGAYLNNDSDVTNWKNTNSGYPDEIYDSLKTLSKNGENYYGYIDPKTPVSDETMKLIVSMNSSNDNDSDSASYKKKSRESDIEQVFKTFEISYIKRPKTQKMEAIKSYSGWSAYNFDSTPSDEKIPLEVDENTPNAIKKVQSAYDTDYKERKGENSGNVFYYTITSNRTIAQERDAQRGMTNEKIKYLFKNKKYYKYDGSVKTAYDIRDDWKEVIENFKKTDAANSASLKSYISSYTRSALRRGLFDLMSSDDIEEAANKKAEDSIEVVLNGYIDLIYYQQLGNEMSDFTFARDLDGDGIVDIASERLKNSSSEKSKIEKRDGVTFDENVTKYTLDPRNPDLISKVDLTTEGLQAFAILENTHTADADYAYRDLKELFVELDYFDKEDLTEPAKDVLEWPLPQTSSYGWPDRAFDKVNDYGTLIHSKEMVDYKNQIYGQINQSNPNALAGTTTSSSTISSSSINGFEKLQPIVSPATAKILEIGKVTINNEGTEEILKPFYTSSDSDYNEEGVSGDSNNRTFVSQAQYDAMKSTAETIEADANSSFGKSYETGYVKLEIIGKESLEKIKVLNNTDLITGFNAYYEDYHNIAQDKSICDSYIIYIEGIDLTGLMEDKADPNADVKLEDTILARKFEEISGQSLVTNQNITSNDNYGSSSATTTTSSTSGFDISSYNLNYYTRKEIPTYYVPAIQDVLKGLEDDKENCMPSVVKIDNDIYVEAGTLLGVTGNANMKIIMKDTNEGVVENVEDYLEIAELNNLSKKGLNIELARFFFIPYEGGLTKPYDSSNGNNQLGAFSCVDTTINDGQAGLAVGVCCWTTYADNSCNNVANLFKYLYQEDPGLFSSLYKYKDMSGSELYSNFSSIKSDLEQIDLSNHDRFLELQFAYKDKEVAELLEESSRSNAKWILDRSDALIGTYYSLVNWIPYPYAYNDIRPGETWEQQLDSSKTDEQNIIALMKFAQDKDGGVGGQHSGRFNSQCRLALDMLNGIFTEEMLTTWMETKGVVEYVEGANPNYINSH